MTREEAISTLDDLIGMIEDNHNTDYDDALRMGIEALKQPDTTTDDCISRQAAIDAFMKATADGDKFEWCECVLKQLPSAQPDYDLSQYSDKLWKLAYERGKKNIWNFLLMYLADIQLTYSPGWGANGCGDEKLHEFVTGLIEELEKWDDMRGDSNG